MPINVSLKNVPDDIADELRKRAKRHHRSLQGELIAILEEATQTTGLTFDQAQARLKALNLKTGDESAAWLRELRDER